MLYVNHKVFGQIVKQIENGQSFKFLKDKKLSTLEAVAAGNAGTLNTRKKENINLSKIYSKLGEADRAQRVAYCCAYRYVLVDSNKRAHNVHTVRCRDRHCIECQRIKSYIYQSRLKRTAIERIKADFKNDRFLFVTFTVKNPKVSEMRKVMRAMSKAFAKLNQRKAFKSVVGGIRCFEVTRGKSKNLKNHCHPHIHCIKQISGDAFDIFADHVDFSSCKNDAEKLKKLKVFYEENWTDCLKQEFKKEGVVWNDADYIKTKNRAMVDVKLVKAGAEKDAPVLTGADFSEFGERVINYVLKYSLKENDKRIFTGDRWSQEFDKQIKGMRMIAPFGLWRSELSKEEKEEYDEKEYFKRFERVENDNSFLAKFDKDDEEYKTESVDVSELKRVKRSMLCIPLVYNNLDLFDKLKKLKIDLKSAKTAKYKDIYDEVESVNCVIEKINDVNKLILSNFEKLVRYGEYAKGERFYVKTYSQPENYYNPLTLEFQDNYVFDKYKNITNKTDKFKWLVLDYLRDFAIEKIDSYKFVEIEKIDIEEYKEIIGYKDVEIFDFEDCQMF